MREFRKRLRNKNNPLGEIFLIVNCTAYSSLKYSKLNSKSSDICELKEFRVGVRVQFSSRD